jgi:hypothetical protein
VTPEPRDAELMAADVLIHATLARIDFPPLAASVPTPETDAAT